MIKKVKLFWSLDVQKTEKWLAAMSAKGLHFVAVNLLTRQFSFQEGSPRQLTYRIGCEGPNYALPKTLINSGWTKVFGERKWYVIVNEEPPNELKTYPVRTGLIRRNNWLLLLCSIILIYGAVNLSIQLTLLGFMAYISTPITIVPSPWWVLTPLIFLAGIAFWSGIIYTCIALVRSNRNLGERVKEQIKDPNSTANVIKKRNYFWVYSPDKLEQWLETMEEQGYNLVQVGSYARSFWFEKGSPRKVKYSVDY